MQRSLLIFPSITNADKVAALMVLINSNWSRAKAGFKKSPSG
jgi:hypothetical protein